MAAGPHNASLDLRILSELKQIMGLRCMFSEKGLHGGLPRVFPCHRGRGFFFANVQESSLSSIRSLLLAALVLCLSATGAAADSLNRIAAVVNGEMITYFDVQAQAAPEILRAGLDPVRDADAEPVRRITRNVLDSMISDILISQEAERLKITVQDSEVDNEYRKIVQRSQLAPEQFERQLAQQGLSADLMRERIRRGILRHRLLGLMIARKVVVTRDEIAKYYEAHKGQFVSGRKVRLGLVIFPPRDDADALAAQVKSGAMTFADLAARHSIGPNPQNGGVIGDLLWSDLSMEWRDTLSELKPGDVSRVFLVEGRKAVLQLVASNEGKGQALDDVAEEIENILREPKMQERLQEYIGQLRSRAVIDIRI